MTPTTEPTATAPAPPDNITPISAAADGMPPTIEDIRAAQEAISKDMADALPFNRLAVHVGFQRAIQNAVAERPKDAGLICSAFRNWAEGESLLRG